MRPLLHPAPQLARSPRLVLAAILALGIVAVALALRMWQPSPVAAEQSVSSEIDTVDDLSASKPASLGKPRDPLSIEELGYAEALAARALPASARTLAGEPGGELLSVDLASLDPDTTTRPVTVTYYDYAADEVLAVRVELYSGQVKGTDEAKGLQPAPAPSEAYAATKLLIESSDGRKLGTEYTAMTGHAITADDLIVTGGSYYSTSVTRADDACGRHRCVELQVQEPSGTYLSTADYVVDLSAQKVIVLVERDIESSLGGS